VRAAGLHGACLVGVAALAAACADVKSQADAASPTGTSTGGAGSGSPFDRDGGAGTSGTSWQDALGAPPTDFTLTMPGVGGYKRGVPLANDFATVAETGQKVCNTIKGVVRDFKGALAAEGGSLEPGGHPDFEVFEGRGLTKGLVAPELLDGKPVYTGQCQTGAAVSPACPFGAMTTSKKNFDQWYRSTEGVNRPFLVYFLLGEPNASGISTFYSSRFFPVDGAGWNNNGKDLQGNPHNFGFTTEIHTTFKYMGGETFTFEGDDDVWVFINHELAVDLGGLHPKMSGSVELDAQAAALGITKGAVYDLDLFHAERHSAESNFKIDLNFTFESCGYVVP
jgi:fibro-slime domain-containing protein